MRRVECTQTLPQPLWSGEVVFNRPSGQKKCNHNRIERKITTNNKISKTIEVTVSSKIEEKDSMQIQGKTTE